MLANAIETNKVSKVFHDGAAAVRDVDLIIPQGTVYGLVGRNGAGKTTLIRILMGLLRPTGGSARVLGEDLWSASRQHRARVAYVQQYPAAGFTMSLVELSYFNSHFYERWDAGYAEKLSERFELVPAKPIASLSGGQQRLAFLIAALAAHPDVLLLDEPAAGLDPVSRRELIDQLIEVISDRADSTIIVSTHIISDLERIADRIGILDNGQLRLSSGVDDLKSDYKRVQIIFPDNPPPGYFSLPNALKYESEGAVVKAIINRADFDVIEQCKQIPGVRIQEFPIGLEDLVIDLMTKNQEKR